MCRLMAFVSSNTLAFPEAAGENFSDFVALSSFHKDGWGIAMTSAHRPQVLLARAPEMAEGSLKFQENLGQMHGNGGLLHLRWATSGLANCEENTHPFVHGQYVFIHNGDIRPRENLDRYIRQELNEIRAGDTDSERYFFLLLTEIDHHGLLDGMKSVSKIIDSNCTYSSMNAMLLTPDELIVISRFNSSKIPAGQPSDYYQLQYQISDGIFRIASSGWPQIGWTPLENNSLLVINRDDLTLSKFFL